MWRAGWVNKRPHACKLGTTIISIASDKAAARTEFAIGSFEQFLRFEEVVRHGHGLIAEAVSVFVSFTEQSDFHEAKEVEGIGTSDSTGDNSLSAALDVP
jgi:hypothetical protein